MIIIWIIFVSSVVVLPATALLALRWRINLLSLKIQRKHYKKYRGLINSSISIRPRSVGLKASIKVNACTELSMQSWDL